MYGLVYHAENCELPRAQQSLGMRRTRCLCTCYEASLKQVMKLEHAACPGIMWETRSAALRYLIRVLGTYHHRRQVSLRFALSLPEDSKYYPSKTCAPPNMKKCSSNRSG